MDQSRRKFLAIAGLAPLAFLAAGSARAADAACYDPNNLPMSQKNRRRSLGFVDVTADPTKHCSVCAFYTASQGNCGTCQMLTGGAVPANGFCQSFAPKG